jgi:hypothetical protein
VRRGISALHRIGNQLLGPLESLALSEADEAWVDTHPPLFIIGAPRSGSTLCYQLLCATLQVGYLSNRHCRWFGVPTLVGGRGPAGPGAASAGFESRFGATLGADAPSECGNYWYRFLPREPHALDASRADAGTVAQLRRHLGGLTRCFGQPLVIKNLMLSVRLPVLAAAFPRARYLVVTRDERGNIASLLDARWRMRGSFEAWFSVRPSSLGGSEGAGDPVLEVSEQVRGIAADIAVARAGMDGTRFMEVSYDGLCARPEATLELVQQFLAATGTAVPRRPGSVVPASFPAGRGRDLPEPLSRRLEELVHG